MDVILLKLSRLQLSCHFLLAQPWTIMYCLRESTKSSQCNKNGLFLAGKQTLKENIQRTDGWISFKMTWFPRMQKLMSTCVFFRTELRPTFTKFLCCALCISCERLWKHWTKLNKTVPIFASKWPEPPFRYFNINLVDFEWLNPTKCGRNLFAWAYVTTEMTENPFWKPMMRKLHRLENYVFRLFLRNFFYTYLVVVIFLAKLSKLNKNFLFCRENFTMILLTTKEKSRLKSIHFLHIHWQVKN